MPSMRTHKSIAATVGVELKTDLFCTHDFLNNKAVLKNWFYTPVQIILFLYIFPKIVSYYNNDPQLPSPLPPAFFFLNLK